MSIELVIPSNHLIFCHPLLLLPSIFPSIRIFSNESVLCIRWPKYWSFSFSITFQWISRTDFLLDWLIWSPCSPRDSQESSPTPKFKTISSLAFSFLYSPTLTSIPDYWKNHSFDQTDLCWQSFLKMLSRLAITSLPQSKCLLISWLQSSSAVILEPKKIKSLIVSIVSPSICHEMMGPDAMIFVFWMLSFKPAFSTLLFHFHQEAL